MNQSDPVKLFICHSNEDEKFKERFDVALKPLKRFGKIEVRQLLAGDNIEDDTISEIAMAEVICLLISPGYINSDKYFTEKIETALFNRRKAGGYVVPVLLRPTPFLQDYEIGKLNALPKDGKPVDTWSNADEAWMNVVTKISELVDHIQKNPNRTWLKPADVPANNPAPKSDHTQPTGSTAAQSPFAPIRKKVQFGKIREAITELLVRTEAKYASEYDTALMLSNRWFNLQQKINGGTITESNAEVEINKISAAILSLINTLEEQTQ